MTIVIIDDYIELAEAVGAMLEIGGYKTKVSNTTRGVTPEPGDVVLMDVDRPGDPVLENPNHCPIIWMSGNPDNNPDLNKPFTGEELMAKLKEYL